MKILKRILSYVPWILISILAAFGYLMILIGPVSQSENEILLALQNMFLLMLIQLCLVAGGVIAIIFILIDVFYLNKKLSTQRYKTPKKFGVLLLITAVVATVHFILEKVIDVI